MNDPVEDVEITNRDKNLGVLSHLAGFVMLFGIPSLFGPLVVWLFNRNNDHVEYHAREALNFNISVTLYAIVSALLILVVVGIVLLPIVLIVWLIASIVAAGIERPILRIPLYYPIRQLNTHGGVRDRQLCRSCVD